MTKEERREYRKKYREKNKEKIKQQKHEAYLRALKRDTDMNAKKYQRYLELHPNGNKERYAKLIENDQNFLKHHYEKYKDPEKQKRKYRTQEGRSDALARKYRQSDKKKGYSIDQNIDKNWIINNIFNSCCIYCGDKEWTHLGADRIDSSKPHTPDNCVCSCYLCNIEKQTKSVEEFRAYRQIHPRTLEQQKSFEIAEMNGIKVLKKRTVV